MNYHREKITTIRTPVTYPEDALPAYAHPESRSYLATRGVTREESEYYDLGYCPSGFWYQRLIIPIYFNDELQCIQGRALTPDIEPRYKTAGWRSCYFLGPSNSRLVIVEGPFDLYAVSRVHSCVLATLGNQPSQAQLLQIRSLPNIDRILILYDREASSEAYALQLLLNPMIPTEVLELEEHKDVGECGPDQVRKILGV